MRNFLDYVKRDKRALVCLILLLLGFALLIIGSLKGKTPDNEELTKEEEKIEQLCRSVSGVGECRVTLSYEGESVAGIIVLCEGGDSVSVKKRLSDMLVTLYDIGYNRIMIDRLC